MTAVLVIGTIITAFCTWGRISHLWLRIKGEDEISLWEENPNTKLGISIATVRLVAALSVLALLFYTGRSLSKVESLSRDLSEAQTAFRDIQTQMNDLTDAYNSEKENNRSLVCSLSEELSTLQEECDTLNESNSALSKNFLFLRSEKNEIQTKLNFYEEHAVIVIDDGTKLYHKYGDHISVSFKSYWIYNTEAARSKGYHPCTKCYPSGYYIGNLNSKVFHEPTCGTLPATWNRTYFDTREEAVFSWYKPCGNCNP